MEAAVIYTVGHSTRSLQELVAVLAGAGVRTLVDVRTVPRSRRHPQFAAEALGESLPAHGIDYMHEKALGGFRRPLPDSPNGGWEHSQFRGYADYMATEQFRSALVWLEGYAKEWPTSVMCAEAQWWRCHRRLIADALLVRGWEVCHLGLGAEPVAHQLTPFAVPGPGGSLTYPPSEDRLFEWPAAPS